LKGKLLKKKLLITIFSVFLIIFALFGTYALRHLYTKNIGLHLVPSQDFTPIELTPWLQNDHEWASLELGESGSKMASIGCLVTSIAMSLEHLGFNITPGELCTALSENGGFTPSGQVIWNRIKEAVPGADYTYSRIFTSRTIDNDLKNGYTPIVMVRYYKTGISHWVAIVGAKDGDYLIMDPLCADRKPIPLYGTHGRVYSYRKIVKRQ